MHRRVSAILCGGGERGKSDRTPVTLYDIRARLRGTPVQFLVVGTVTRARIVTSLGDLLSSTFSRTRELGDRKSVTMKHQPRKNVNGNGRLERVTGWCDAPAISLDYLKSLACTFSL